VNKKIEAAAAERYQQFQQPIKTKSSIEIKTEHT
jgi:hypothetical protein